jgi:hypothetical protein
MCESLWLRAIGGAHIRGQWAKYINVLLSIMAVVLLINMGKPAKYINVLLSIVAVVRLINMGTIG